MSAHNILVSWSGTFSHQIALALRDWMPDMLPEVKPWVSSEDIAKGRPWFQELMAQLQTQTMKICVICLTPDNLDKPWLYYEAGAVAAKSPDTIVCPFLVGLDGVEIQGTPFNQLQWTKYDRADTLKLIRTINQTLPSPHHDSLLSNSYTAVWPNLKRRVDKAIVDNPLKAMKLTSTAETTEPKLSNEAATILREASRDPDGTFVTSEDSEGFGIQTNSKNLCPLQDAATKARFKGAIKNLLQLGFVDQTGDGVYELTVEGHERATSLYKEARAFAAQKINKEKIDNDSVSKLETWWNRRGEGERLDVVHTDGVDSYLGLPSGSTMRLLESVVKPFGYVLVRQGEKTLLFKERQR